MNKRGMKAIIATIALVIIIVNIIVMAVIMTKGEYLPENIREILVKLGILPPDVNIEIENYDYDCISNEKTLSVLIKIMG